jgi:hypothetical protein
MDCGNQCRGCPQVPTCPKLRACFPTKAEAREDAKYDRLGRRHRVGVLPSESKPHTRLPDQPCFKCKKRPRAKNSSNCYVCLADYQRKYRKRMKMEKAK